MSNNRKGENGINRLKNAFFNTKGTSIVLVMCFILLVFAISGSLLFASSSASSTQLRHQENVKCAVFTNGLAARVSDMIEAPVSPGSCWYALAQQVYEKKASDPDADVEITASGLTFTPEDTSLWVAGSSAASAEFTITGASAVITQEYVAKTDEITENGVVIVPARAAIPEITKLEIKMNLKLTVKYGRSKNTNTIYAAYEFNGEASGTAGAGVIIADKSGWKLTGYFRQ